jgi:hypothetical protein
MGRSISPIKEETVASLRYACLETTEKLAADPRKEKEWSAQKVSSYRSRPAMRMPGSKK